MSKRPPLLGYNHNVRHKGQLFHVQTEDSGLGRLVLFTHVFVEGTILASIRGTYSATDPDAAVQKQMQAQHKAMLRRVRDSEFDAHPEVLARAATGGSHPVKDADAVPTPAVPLETSAASTREAGAPSALLANDLGAQRHVVKTEPPKTATPLVIIDPSLTSGTGADTTQKWGAGDFAARLGIQPGVKSLADLSPEPLQRISATTLELGSEDMEPLAASHDDDDDDMTIDIEEPESTSAEADAEELSKATPLPVAIPLAAQEVLEPPPKVQPKVPVVVSPLFQVSVPPKSSARPVRQTLALQVRPIHTGRLRLRPTSEGAVVLMTGMHPAARMPLSDALRSSQVLLRTSYDGRGARGEPPKTGKPGASPAKPGPALPSMEESVRAFLRRDQPRSPGR